MAYPSHSGNPPAPKEHTAAPSPEDRLEDEYKPRNTKNVEFPKTKAYKLIKDFLFKIDLSLKTQPQEAPTEPDPYIDRIAAIVRDTPLSDEPARFANAAMKHAIRQICSLTEDLHLRQSFGNLIRMDFGTGHELNYLCYLYKRHIHGHLRINETAAVLRKYFKVVREFIKKFNVEAAGARGCWSLDDYMLLPYLFGTSENFGREESLGEIESGMFREAWDHRQPSGMLDSMLRLGWKSMNLGLLRMYDEEVLGKRVVT